VHVSAEAPAGGNGTRAHPWRSLRRALQSADPGDTIVLARGTYGRRGTRFTIARGGAPDRPITIRGRAGDRRPRLLGHVQVRADHVRLSDLAFEGPTGRVAPVTDDNPHGEEVPVWIRGDDVEIVRSEVSHSRWHAGIYVTGDGARILANHIHHNGDFGNPDQAGLDHGIYWGAGRGGVIANNLIDANYAYGVQLYPGPQRVRVVGNTIVGNGLAGVILSDAAAGNTVASNIIAFNGRPSITFELQGTDNRSAGNLFWANGETAVEVPDPVEQAANIVADPGFVGASDYRLRAGSPALDRALPAYSAPRDIRGLPRSRPADIGAFERE
ncbi:MAG: right-handed parallel beta-helix repeat-containing protein, partial [Thermoleophilaceae bacterium]